MSPRLLKTGGEAFRGRLVEKFEHALDYDHGEFCGCGDAAHEAEWSHHMTFRQDEVRYLAGLLESHGHRETVIERAIAFLKNGNFRDALNALEGY